MDKLETEPNSIIHLDRVSVELDQALILSDVSFELRPGEIVAVMGPNGAGKTTMLKAIVGEVALLSGTVQFFGQTERLMDHQIVERGIGYVPQGRRVFPSMSVKENLELGCLWLKNKAEVGRRIEKVCTLFPDLKEKTSSRAGDLSGGQQQMVALGRALMSQPKAILLDEPTIGLAPMLVKAVFETIETIRNRFGTAICIIEHNVEGVLSIADRAYVLGLGKIAYSGNATGVVSSGILERVFVGRS